MSKNDTSDTRWPIRWRGFSVLYPFVKTDNHRRAFPCPSTPLFAHFGASVVRARTSCLIRRSFGWNSADLGRRCCERDVLIRVKWRRKRCVRDARHELNRSDVCLKRRNTVGRGLENTRRE